MKKVLLVLVVIALMAVGFASDVELFGGPLFEYDANGFKFGYDAGANYGVDLGVNTLSCMPMYQLRQKAYRLLLQGLGPL